MEWNLFLFSKMKNSYLTWLLPNFDKHRTIYEPLLGKLWRETCFWSTRWKTLTSHGYCPTLTNIGPSMSLCLVSYEQKLALISWNCPLWHGCCWLLTNIGPSVSPVARLSERLATYLYRVGSSRKKKTCGYVWMAGCHLPGCSGFTGQFPTEFLRIALAFLHLMTAHLCPPWKLRHNGR